MESVPFKGVHALTVQGWAESFPYAALPATLQLAKSALLYADRVEICSLPFHEALSDIDPWLGGYDDFWAAKDALEALQPEDDPRESFRGKLSGHIDPDVELFWEAWQESKNQRFPSFWEAWDGTQDQPSKTDVCYYPTEEWDGSKRAAKRVTNALWELHSAVRAGALILPPKPYEASFHQIVAAAEDPNVVPVIEKSDAKFYRSDRPGGRRVVEGALIPQLFGEIEAFPAAPMDVVLDVRARIVPGRIRLQAAIADAARQLSEAFHAGERIEAVTADLRQRVIAPAVTDIEGELSVLGVRGTLLRLASDPQTVGAVTGGVALGAALPGSALKLAALVPVATSTAREMLFRDQTRERAAMQPFWSVREAARGLARRPKQ